VRQLGDGQLELTGDPGIHDVTRPVTLRGSFAGPSTDSWGGRRAGRSLAGELDREAFGLAWNPALEAGGATVGRKAALSVEAELVDAAAALAA